ncbi:sialate O-acetylesterase [Occallatibacter savannae]|uniref:sialate O-acetylesterase n=1 Tax=Occallatibacter savannae TaxID=1002691 RepID=UPI000D69AC2B|nr:sialate O-acetylesterase [Occallatibacter savannae]
MGQRYGRSICILVITLSIAGFRAVSQPTPGQTAQTPNAKALPFVSTIFGDNMVLQRGKPDAIWGWSDPGDTIRVEMGEKTATAVAGPDRRWQLKIDPPAAGGPYTLKISGHQTFELHNVLVGDVWLCGGQSNMGLPLRFTKNADEEIKAANYPEIRFFTVAGHPAYHHVDVIDGKWQAVSPETASWISAVGYYFARRVQKDVHIPIGLVVDAVGGTPAESWTSEASLRPLHDFDIPLAELDRLKSENAPEYGNYVMHWYDRYDTGQKNHWAAPELDDSAWKSVPVPGGFAELGVPDTPAVAWFRKEIVLPDPLPKATPQPTPAPGPFPRSGNMLSLGEIERMDTAYVNGIEVGGSSWVENPRRYFIRDGILKPGRNIIAIRVLKSKPVGGFLSKPEELNLTLADGTKIPLAGEWKAKLSVDAKPPQELPIAYENWPIMPAVLYEGMLSPIAPISITGAIWYQGEQNSPRGYQYRKILPAMIADWRALFAQGDFPFYIVSLPAFTKHSDTPVNGDDWTELRESQAVAAAAVPNACLAVTIDTGEADNIHSKDKEPVGDRLARCALAKQYGEKIVYSGPTLESVERAPGAIRLHFAHTDGGLVTKGDKLGEFSIAGDDRNWVWADAHIEGDTVVVSSPAVPHPTEVRYAWQSNPVATLFNGAGLPAAPFRTDNWPGKTEGVRPY